MTPADHLPREALDAVLADLRGSQRSPELDLCAQLFSAHVPLTRDDLAESMNIPPEAVDRCLASLQSRLESSVLGVFTRRKDPHTKGPQTSGYVLDLKPAFRRVSPAGRPVLPPSLTETLALIALNQPISQSRLVRERGTSVYEHVKDLVQRDWIQRSKRGRSYELRTTETFAAEFGLPNDPELIKKALARTAGFQGQPDLVGSPRVQFDEGAEQLVAEARSFVPAEVLEPVHTPEPVVETPPAEVAAEVVTVEAPQPVVEPPAKPEPKAAEPEPDPVVVRPTIPSRPTRRIVMSMPLSPKKKDTAQSDDEATPKEVEMPSRVAHLLNLLGDESTVDDW